MWVFGQIQNAQLENKASDYSGGPIGRLWFNTTTGKFMVDDGTNVRAMLRNDGHAIIGSSGTANSNIRFHRGAAGVLQLVTGGDVTAEGTLSTSLNQFSGRAENYTTGSLPAAGNAGRLAWDTTLGVIKADTGAAWIQVGPGSPYLSPIDNLNYGFTSTVGASALTINLKTNAGADPSSGDPVKISFRSATSTTGTYSQVSSTAATTIVVPSGATLGHTSAINQYVWIYALNNAGTIELAVSGVKLFDDGSIQSTTIMSAGSTSGTVLYSTTARTNVAIRLIGRILIQEATAGTWATAPAEISTKFTPNVTITEWANDKAFTVAGFGTISNSNFWYKRVGDTMFVRGSFTSGTVAAATASFGLDGGSVLIDTAKLSSGTSIQAIGTMIFLNTGGSTYIYATNSAWALFYDGSTNNTVYMAENTAANVFTKQNGSTIGTSSAVYTFEWAIPIAGWSTYGP